MIYFNQVIFPLDPSLPIEAAKKRHFYLHFDILLVKYRGLFH